MRGQVPGPRVATILKPVHDVAARTIERSEDTVHAGIQSDVPQILPERHQSDGQGIRRQGTRSSQGEMNHV